MINHNFPKRILPSKGADVNVLRSRLAAYETQNYQADPCRIRYTDGKEPADDIGYTFKFKGNPKELSEGSFDLRVWLERMGRLAAVEKLDAKRTI